MKKTILTLLLLSSITVFSQVKQQSNNLFSAKEWSKEISLFRCKAFLFQDVLGVSETVNKLDLLIKR